MGTTRYTVVDGEIITEKRNGTRKLYVPDPLGSTVALLDTSQNQTDTFTYWPYGEEKSRTGTTETPFRFVGVLGYYRDAVIRNYVRARYLRMDQGRWLTEDPIGLAGDDLNIYRYVKGNPASFNDILGLAGADPPCSFPEFSPFTKACAQKCLQEDGGYIKVRDCLVGCLKKSTRDWIVKLACKIVACTQYGGLDPCSNPDAKTDSVDCQRCASFELTQCLCVNAGLHMGIKCWPSYECKFKKCLDLQ